MPLSNPLTNLVSKASQRTSVDERKLQVVGVVALVGTVGRFLDPSLQVVTLAGLLAGAMNGPRTGEWEHAATFAGLPAAYGGVVVGLLLFASVPLGAYSFPIHTVWGETLFSAIGPVFETLAYAVLYFVEGVVSFVVVKRLPGVPSSQPD